MFCQGVCARATLLAVCMRWDHSCFSFHCKSFYSFFWKVCICSAKGGTPLNPRFLFPFFLFFSLLFFSLLLFCLLSLLFAVAWNLLFFRQSVLCIAGGTCAQSKLLDRELVGCDCRINERVFLRSVSIQGCRWWDQTCSRYARRVRFSVRSRTTFCLPPSFAVPSPRFARP